MADNFRGKPADSKHGVGKKLTSINFPFDLIDWLDEMSKETGINRSSLVVIMVQNFRESGKTIGLTVGRAKPMTIDELVATLPEPNSKQKPILPLKEREKRNEKMREMFKNGYSRQEIAAEVGLHYQTVYDITRGLKVD